MFSGQSGVGGWFERVAVRVKICRVNKLANLPAYATEGAVGLDLQTMERIWMRSGRSRRVSTGVAIALPVGYEAQIRPRSSVSGKGLIVNLGTVDADYRGELMLNITYVGPPGEEDYPYEAEVGQRIAQLVIVPVPRVLFDEVDSVEELGSTARGDNGFGSTGA